MPLKLKRKKRLAGERAGLKKARIILTASRQFETTESLKILTLAKALGVVPTTIKSHFRGGAPRSALKSRARRWPEWPARISRAIIQKNT